MKNRETRKRIIIFTLLCALVLGGFLASYAYFIAGSNNNNKEALKINSGNMALTFSDGSSNFQGSLNFGESATKTFTIENTGSIDAVARLKWDNLINTYLSGSLTYTLSYRETEDGEYTEIISNKDVPRSQQPASRVLANDLSIPVNKTYYYKLTITLNYLEDIDQTADLNAIFSTNFILEDISSELAKNVMIARASYDSTDYFWEHSENIKKVVFENSLYPKENASYTYDISEKKDGSVMSYLVPDTEDTSKYTLYIQANDYISANPNSSHLFYKFTTLENIEGLEYLNTSNVTNMSGMFSSCSKLITLDVSNFDTSNVTNMIYMFDGCSSLTSLDVTNFDTSNVTNMYGMFWDCNNLTSLDVSNFDTSNVTTMYGMFASCTNLTSLDVSNFDTSRVTDMIGMFNGCSSLTSLDVSNFDTSKALYMNSMFENCINLRTTITIRNTYTVSNDRIFQGAATENGARIVVNYTSESSSLVDKMIATKSSNSNVVKGSLVNS